MESLCEDVKQTNNETKRKRDGRTENKKWKDDDAQVLIELFEEPTCL